MREEDAKTKWCPMVRFHNGADNDVYSNMLDGRNDFPYCSGSECMMWRYIDEESKSGYCGLAK